jgi:hypothetical protein
MQVTQGVFVQAAERAETRQPGHQDGVIGRNGLAVIRALLGLVNFATGGLVPAVITIARHACISVRSAFRGLKSLKLAGLLTWQKRAIRRVREDGSFLMEQDTSAYVLLPPGQWRVTAPKAQPAEPPPPEPGTWGDHAPIEEDHDDGSEHDHAVRLEPPTWGRPADYAVVGTRLHGPARARASCGKRKRLQSSAHDIFRVHAERRSQHYRRRLPNGPRWPPARVG